MKLQTINVTKEQLRTYLVLYHHLTHTTALESKDDVLSFIKKVGCIQYDPINILAYNSHLVLQSRVHDYNTEDLNELLYKSYQLIDGWDKNLSIYPIEDDHLMAHYRDRAKSYHSKLDKLINEAKPAVLGALQDIGPITSIDIKDSPTIDWWWAPTKAVRAALDHMFACGDIYVHHKVNTRKYYDLIDNHPHIKRNDNNPFLSQRERLSWQILRRINGVGLLPAKRNSYAFIAIDGLKAAERKNIIEDLINEGTIVTLKVSGIDELYYMDVRNQHLLDSVVSSPCDSLLIDGLGKMKASIIAPLDNLIWDRDMIKELFNFEYVWEVYKPKSQRVYGYYVLPVLYGNQFVGRFEGKHNRQTNTLEIVNWYFEDSTTIDENYIVAMAVMLKDFRQFLGAGKVKIMSTCKNKKIVGQIKNTQFTL